MGMGRWAVEIFQQVAEIYSGAAWDTYSEMAEAGYDVAMSMCGNDGQVAIIENTGFDAFYDSAYEYASNKRAITGYEILRSRCPHPDAVSTILLTAMLEMISVFRGEVADAIEEGMAEMEEEEEYE